MYDFDHYRVYKQRGDGAFDKMSRDDLIAQIELLDRCYSSDSAELAERLEEASAFRNMMISLDLILHDKQYRFEQANDLWYSRETGEYYGLQGAIDEIVDEVRSMSGNENY